MFVNQQLPSDLRATERKGGDRRPGDTRLPAHGCSFRLLEFASPPARRRHLGRNLPGAYRNFFFFVQKWFIMQNVNFYKKFNIHHMITESHLPVKKVQKLYTLL